MANPTKIETVYDKAEQRWRRLPHVKNNGRAQAFPFILVLVICYAGIGIGLTQLIDLVGNEWEQKSKTAVFMLLWVTALFSFFMTVMIRSAKRNR